MAHTIIYDNLPAEGGYGLYGRSVGFPADYEAAVAKISSLFGPGSGSGESTAVRYAPLGEKYLLSWVLRHPMTRWENRRGWHTVVHFLLDGGEAEELFQHPVAVIARWAEENGEKLWRSRERFLPRVNLPADDGTYRPRREEEMRLDAGVMMAGAFYCGVGQGNHQLFLESEDPWGELDRVRMCLPCELRKDLSFCIGLENQQESQGAVFNFPTGIHVSQLRSAVGEGSSMTDKYWHGEAFRDGEMYEQSVRLLRRLNECSSQVYGIILRVVTDWDQLACLAADSLEEGLEALIRSTGQEVWCHQLADDRLMLSDVTALQQQIPRTEDTRLIHKELRGMVRTHAAPRQEQKAPREPAVRERASGFRAAFFRVLLRLVALLTLGAALAAFALLLRHVLTTDTQETGRVIYYCISREAAADVLKLLASFFCGGIAAWAVFVLASGFRRKK